MVRLGSEDLVNVSLKWIGRLCGATPGRKVLILDATILRGWSHIDPADRLRACATSLVLWPDAGASDARTGTYLRTRMAEWRAPRDRPSSTAFQAELGLITIRSRVRVPAPQPRCCHQICHQTRTKRIHTACHRTRRRCL